MAGLYIHIPFCKSRCVYCGFYSTTLSSRRQAYVYALCEEMRLREKPSVNTIYIGGGTPSQLTSRQLVQLFDAIAHTYTVDPDAEITMECNPDDVNAQFASLLSSLPVNRVSIGIQTFDGRRLQFLRRRNTASQAKEAVGRLREAGIHNISIDLMFAFPGQTVADFDDDIHQALELGVPHISSYSPSIEEGTPLYEMRQREEIDEPDDDLYVEMYKTLARRLTDAGYEHYEISNFAQPGFRSRHNSNYWTATPYLGIGAAAHSYDLVSRQWNVADIEAYIKAINNGILPSEREELTLRDRYNDLIATALRTSWGINLESARQEYGADLFHHLQSQASRWIASGHLTTESGRMRLTLKGIVVSDSIMRDLIVV